MGTPGYVGVYDNDKKWRAVRVKYDGYPNGLGAALLRAIVLHGGDYRKVIDYTFTTRDWVVWPTRPGHPLGQPDDEYEGPGEYWDDSWSYFVDLKAARLDVRTSTNISISPERSIQLDQSLAGDELGPSGISLSDFVPVISRFERVCVEPVAVLLTELFQELGIPSGDDVGVATHPAETSRHIHFGGRRVHLRTFDFSGAEFFHGDESALAMPDFFKWFEARPTLWDDLAGHAQLPLGTGKRSHMMWMELFDGLFENAASWEAPQ